MSSQRHSISVLINESAFLNSHYTLDFELNENHSVQIQQSTFVTAYLLHLSSMSKKDWPTNPISFKMDRSIFGILACCPQIVSLTLPQSQFPKTPTESKEMLRRSFREFDARDNIAQFWGSWATVGTGKKRHMLNGMIFPEFPTRDQTVRFGKRIEQMRNLIHKKRDQPAASRLAATVLPKDFIPTSTGPLAERMKAGIRYGCDVTKLPVPPPSTLQPYKIPKQPVPNKKK